MLSPAFFRCIFGGFSAGFHEKHFIPAQKTAQKTYGGRY